MQLLLRNLGRIEAVW